MLTLITAVIFAFLAFSFLASSMKIVNHSSVMIIERFGSYHRTLQSGINFIIPFLDQPRAITLRDYERSNGQVIPVKTRETKIDMRERVLQYPSQTVTTADNVTVQIDGAIYYQITDASSAIYKIEDFVEAIETLAKTSLRSVAGQMALDSLFSSRESMNANILEKMASAVEKWGVNVARIEVQDIKMPESVSRAMELQMSAEREKRALELKAEGAKNAAIKTADGERQSQVLRAQGIKESEVLQAEGQKDAINLIVSSMGDDSDSKATAIGYLLGREYLQTLPHIAQDGERVFIPYEASNMLAALGSINLATGADTTKVGLVNGMNVSSASNS